jgi:hypothetical protein
MADHNAPRRSEDEGPSRGRDRSRRPGCARFRKHCRNERRIAASILVFWSLMHGLTLLLVGPSRKTDELSESVLQHA